VTGTISPANRPASSARLPGVVLGHEAGRQVDVGVAVDQRRVRRHFVAAHRHEAHRLGAAGHDGPRLADADAVGGHRNRLQARGAEAVHGDRRGRHRQSGAQAGDARDVQPLLGFRHRAADDDIVDVAGLDAAGARQRLAHDEGGQFIRPREAQRALRRLAHRRADGGDDDGVLHISPSSRRAAPRPHRRRVSCALRRDGWRLR
jgi:hypothetical protein